MSFLSPWFLAGALLVAGPIIAHLIRRSTRDRTRFTATRFLTESQPRLQRRSRLQHPLLLLLRCLVVALLALAFARPFFRDQTARTTSASLAQDVVIVLDESASMRRAGLWDEARERVVQIASTLRAQDRCSVLLAAGSVTTLMAGELWQQHAPDDRIGLLRTLLAKREAGWGPSYLDSAIDSALDAFFESETETSRRRLVIVSDLASGTRIAGLAARDWPPGLEISLAQTTPPIRSNASLTWLGWTEPTQGPAQARFRIARDRGALRLPLRLQLAAEGGGQTATPAVDLDLAPGEARVVTLPVVSATGTPLRAELSGDSETFDNVAWVVPNQRRELPVVYLGSHDAADSEHAHFYLFRALSPPGPTQISLSRVPPTGEAASTLPAAILYVVAEPLPPALLDVLRTRLAQGAHAVALVNSAEAVQTAASLAAETGWTVGTATRRDALFGKIDFSHPLFALFADPRYSDFTRIRFWKPTPLHAEATERTRILARFEDDSAAIIETDVGRGKLITFGSDWSPRAGQWVLSTKFVPWLHAVVERASGGPARPFTAAIGSATALSDSRQPEWRASDSPENAFVRETPQRPGAYQLRDDAGVRWVSLQVPAEESRTDPMSLDAFEQLGVPLKVTDVAAARVPSQQPAFDQAAFETENRQKLWRWLLLATAALLGLESVLALLLARRSDQPEPTASGA